MKHQRITPKAGACDPPNDRPPSELVELLPCVVTSSCRHSLMVRIASDSNILGQARTEERLREVDPETAERLIGPSGSGSGAQAHVHRAPTAEDYQVRDTERVHLNRYSVQRVQRHPAGFGRLSAQ